MYNTYTFGRQELVQVVTIEKYLICLVYLPPNSFWEASTEGAVWEGVSVQSYEVVYTGIEEVNSTVILKGDIIDTYRNIGLES